MNSFRIVLERVERVHRRHRLFRRGGRLVAGISGGSDSMALLEILSALQRKHSYGLVAAHLDHSLQKDSARACELVRAACARRQIPFVWQKVDVAAWSKKKGLSLEDAGRQLRYRLFEKTAKRVGASTIATAHTRDDQTETLLLRLLRGSGPKGLAGIPYIRPHGRSLRLIRPLLDCTKKELSEALKRKRVPFLTDKTNRDRRFARNRVRHHLLPLLRKRYNPRIDEALIGLQTICVDMQAYLGPKTRAATRRLVSRLDGKRVRIRGQALKKYPLAVRREVLREALSALQGDLAGFGTSHVTAALDLLDSSKPKAETHLPHRVRVIKNGQNLTLTRA